MGADRRRPDQEDDGRTIVDMSGVERPNPFGFRRLPKEPALPEEQRRANADSWKEQSVSREERRWLILGTIKASLLVGGAFAAGMLAVILWFLFIGH